MLRLFAFTSTIQQRLPREIRDMVHEELYASITSAELERLTFVTRPNSRRNIPGHEPPPYSPLPIFL